jgi:hypothetical protein
MTRKGGQLKPQRREGMQCPADFVTLLSDATPLWRYLEHGAEIVGTPRIGRAE